MTEKPNPHVDGERPDALDSERDVVEGTERLHAQEPAEGPDPEVAGVADEPGPPRVHPQDPAEG